MRAVATIGRKGVGFTVMLICPRGSRYLIIKELGLKDQDYYGFWGLSP